MYEQHLPININEDANDIPAAIAKMTQYPANTSLQFQFIYPSIFNVINKA